MGHRRIRVLAVLAAVGAVALPLVGAPASGVATAAEAVPTASCYDLLAFDGLDTRYTSRHCRAAAAAAGYSAASYTNASALGQLSRQGTDAVYYFSGHALVDVDYYRRHAAVGLFHEFPKPKQDVDALMGDPSAAPYLQGPMRICDESGRDCRDVVLTSYPWATELEQHNLVVLQSCNTAGSNENFLGMAETTQLGGAGTTIGFRGLVYFPVNCPNCDSTGIRWSRVFWDNLRAGYTYTTATIRAANSLSGGYGYGTYKIVANPDSPQRLRPAQYYVWPGGGVDPTPQGTSGSADDVAERALERWLGTATNGQWQPVSDSDGARVESYRPGSGLFEVDKASGRITEAIFENEITDGTATLTEELAVRNAREFADRRGENLADLEFRNAEFVDHGTFSEYRVTWQARQGGAWLPSRVTVGVNAASGRVIYYSSDPTQAEAGSEPSITAQEADRSAMRLLDGAGWRQQAEPSLEVVIDETGSDRLVWIHELAREQSGGVHVPEAVVIWTDARTGQAAIQAQT